MSAFTRLKALFVSNAQKGFHEISESLNDEQARGKISKKTLAIATGFGFGLTLEAGLATIFGVATGGLMAVAVGGAVMYAYMNMPDEHHHHVLNLGQSAIDKLAEAIKSPSSTVEKGLQLELDEALSGNDDIALQVVSHDIHNGDVIHVTKPELERIVAHKLTL